MSDVFQKHRDKRISEMRERMRISRIKEKKNVIIFSQRVNKAWKNINKIKSNWKIYDPMLISEHSKKE